MKHAVHSYGRCAVTLQTTYYEVGIRKILRASIADIATLLSKDFIVLVFIAGVIACPVAYYFMDKWLNGFVNHIAPADNAWVFVFSAALANPTDSLRNE